jgi:hypothetical protein
VAFFRNRGINLLNLHYGIHCIALSGGAAFFAVYLLKSGVPMDCRHRPLFSASPAVSLPMPEMPCVNVCAGCFAADFLTINSAF